MARVQFRQGIISYPRSDASNEQEFLRARGSAVDLTLNFGTSSKSVLLTFIHGDADYLFAETRNIDSAWSGLTGSSVHYLFWELDLDTGRLSRGHTTLEPIISSRQPRRQQRQMGQMWFDTKKNQWFEYSSSTWLPVIRVFAAKYVNQSRFESMSINSPDLFSGTQIGSLSGQRSARNVGFLVYNPAGKAIKRGIGSRFFTTEDEFLTGAPSAAKVKVGNQVITAKARCPVAAYQVVEYTDYDEFCIANPAKQGERFFGIIEEDVVAGEVASIISEGVIVNELWDWKTAGAKINDPVYINLNGELTLTKVVSGRPAVGIVIGRKEIFFSPRLFPEIKVEISNNTGAGGLSQSQLDQINDNTTKVNTNASNINSLNGITTDLNTRLGNVETTSNQLATDVQSKLDISGGTLNGSLILKGTPTLPNEASTKKYVDDISRGIQISFNIGAWNVVGTSIEYQISASLHTLPLNIYYDVLVFDAAGKRISISYSVNTTTGLITIVSAGAPFAGTVRIR